MSKEYRVVAKKLGVTYLFGRWGFNWRPTNPSGMVLRLFSIVPLDGWILDSKKVAKIMEERDYEL